MNPIEIDKIEKSSKSNFYRDLTSKAMFKIKDLSYRKGSEEITVEELRSALSLNDTAICKVIEALALMNMISLTRESDTEHSFEKINLKITDAGFKILDHGFMFT